MGCLYIVAHNTFMFILVEVALSAVKENRFTQFFCYNSSFLQSLKAYCSELFKA